MSEQPAITRETPTLTPNENIPGNTDIEAYGHKITVDSRIRLVRIDAASFYEDPDFLRYLNANGRTATWHKPGEEPHEHSDVFFTFGGASWTPDNRFLAEGSDYPSFPDQPGIPENIYALIAEAVKQQTGSSENEALIWIANL